MKSGIPVEDMKSSVSETLSINGRQLTFGDLEGRHLICKGESRPYKRCLNFHSSKAFDFALEKGWITVKETLEYQWSEDFDQTGIAKYLESIQNQPFEDLDVDPIVVDTLDRDEITSEDFDEFYSDRDSFIS